MKLVTEHKKVMDNSYVEMLWKVYCMLYWSRQVQVVLAGKWWYTSEAVKDFFTEYR